MEMLINRKQTQLGALIITIKITVLIKINVHTDS